jgi:hypothetical protein
VRRLSGHGNATMLSLAGDFDREVGVFGRNFDFAWAGQRFDEAEPEAPPRSRLGRMVQATGTRIWARINAALRVFVEAHRRAGAGEGPPGALHARRSGGHLERKCERRLQTTTP